MNKQKLIDKLTELAKDFYESASFNYSIFNDEKASAYGDCTDRLEDLIKDVKENLTENTYIKDEDLFWEVQKKMNLHYWEFSYVGDGWGGVYIEFTATLVDKYKIHSNQFSVLRSLLDYLNTKGTDLEQQMWDKFVIAYKLENCDV